MRPTILLTRPEDSAARFTAQLRQRFGDIRIVQSPLLRIVPVEGDWDVTPYQALIFTSAQGVARGPRGRECYVVGQVTAQAATDAGMRVVAVEPDAQSLIRRILADPPPGPLLHLRGEHARGDIAQTLTAAGIPTQEKVIYAQTECPLNTQAQALLQEDSPVLVPLFSPRTARIFADQARGAAPLWIAALSPAVAQELHKLPARLEIAKTPDARAMLDATQRLMDAGC